MAPNPTVVEFGTPYPSYECTVLFMVSNFQYLVTCLAFSISKPFRKAFWTNYPFFACVFSMTLFNTVCIFMPANSGIPTLFNLLPFTKDGVEYTNYKF